VVRLEVVGRGEVECDGGRVVDGVGPAVVGRDEVEEGPRPVCERVEGVPEDDVAEEVPDAEEALDIGDVLAVGALLDAPGSPPPAHPPSSTSTAVVVAQVLLMPQD
jgi:hypothetical protein